MELRNSGMLNDKQLTERIIGAAIAVHCQLGPGFLESFYEEALALELNALRIPFQRQLTVPVFYRDQKIGEHRLDFLVGSSVVLELKAIHELDKIHYSIVRSYMKATNVQTGLIFKFRFHAAHNKAGRSRRNEP